MTLYTNNSISDEVVDDYCNSILKNLHKSFSIQNIDETVVKNALHNSFGNGDIPLIQLDVLVGENSNLRINGSIFATTDVYKDKNAIKNIFIASIKYLAEISSDELTKALLPLNR